MVLVYIPWLILILVWAAVPFAFLGKGRAVGLTVVGAHLALSGLVVVYGALDESWEATMLASVVLPGVITALMRLAMEFTGTLHDPDRPAGPPANRD